MSKKLTNQAISAESETGSGRGLASGVNAPHGCEEKGTLMYEMAHPVPMKRAQDIGPGMKSIHLPPSPDTTAEGTKKQTQVGPPAPGASRSASKS